MNNKDFEKKLESLNENQRQAVNNIEGPVMVVAGPGTGKTTILTYRIANILLKSAGTDPESILALTFTTAGVISMRQKLIEVIDDMAYRVNIYTFHSFCEHIIKEFDFYFKNLSQARVITDLERVSLIEKIISQNKFEHLISFHDEYSFLNKIIKSILAIKHEGLSPKDFEEKIPIWKQELLASDDIYYKRDFGQYKKGQMKPAEIEKINKKIAKAEELALIYLAYQEELTQRGLYDFSDMILYVLRELVNNQNLKADLQEKYQYLLIDEHQDTNQGQNELIELLTDASHLEGHPNVFAVGDEKQSIYRFQGASAKTFNRFFDLYRDITQINLTENYRSTQNILDGAHSLIIKTKGLENSLLLKAQKKENIKIKILEFSNIKFELLHLVNDIRDKIDGGVSPSEIAVLYRANKNLSDIKTIFNSYQIPYTIYSKDHILDDPQINNLINILRIINNPKDDHYFAKALFAKFLNFDASDIIQIIDSRRGKEKYDNIFSILDDKNKLQGLNLKEKEKFEGFIKVIKELIIESANNNFLDFFKIYLDKIGYIKYLLSSNGGQDELAKLDKIMDEIKSQMESKRNYNLSDFIYFVDSYIKYGLDINITDPEIIEGVSLMTAHGSKGREFEFVYLVNATRASWEGSRGNLNIALPIYQYDGDVDDERRLFYVAMTRAKIGLTISYAKLDNEGREHEKTEFIKEIIDSVKEEQTMKEFEEKNMDQIVRFFDANKKPEFLLDPKYLLQLFYARGLNVSALNNYFDCPLKYLYKNLIRIPDTYSSSLTFGNIVHKALESFFRQSKEQEKILGKEVLLNQFIEALNKLILTDKEKNKFEENGRQILEEYYDEYAKSWMHNVSVEFNPKRILKLKNGKELEINGKIDKLEYLDQDKSGRVNLIDYKTGKTFSEKSKEEKEDYERQIIFYHLLLAEQENYKFKIEKSILDFLQRNKKGQYEQYSLSVTEEHLEKLEKEINDFVLDIESMKFLEHGCGKKDCEWCKLKNN